MQIAKEKAEESDKLKTSFLANMSHEIRTPMNGILGFADLLKSPDLSTEEKEEYIQIIEKSGQRMLNIINDLIDISKIEAGQIELHYGQTYIDDIIDELYKFFKPLADSKGLILRSKKDNSFKNRMIQSDRFRITQVLSNLINNALKFTQHGTIEFGYIEEYDKLEFYISDTGIGISPELKESIFERFRQADHSLSRDHEGSGLGLSISKALVEMHGGQIWVDSTLNQGSTFYFTIPCNLVQDRMQNDKPEKSPTGESSLVGLPVLVAEDDEISFIFIEKLLQEEEMKIIHAKNGIEALEMLEENDVSVILMDLKMPKMSGLEATKIIREKYPHLPIIAQTAFALAEDEKMAMEAGCTAYISKPINKEELFELINKHVMVL